ncbi:2-nitropropane dioxygenase [Burkholderia gladioli]|nr:PfaD family polyunsaturated fatty acid/polyketide biosynthesis protein [Burkholderia gladioli]KVM65567.1 2-nitropropane dioxygenase [Burkholderia gladioli]
MNSSDIGNIDLDGIDDRQAAALGSPVFRERHGVRLAYVAGAMYRGTASPELVVRMGRAGLIGFLGTGGMERGAIEAALVSIRGQLRAGEAFGVNLLADYDEPEAERANVELYLQHDVRIVEAAAFTHITPALVLFRASGLSRGEDGEVRCAHRILAKVSRLEVAEVFMNPAPEALLQALREEGAITAEQARLAAQVPMSHDICVEADSGGHTDGGIPTILLPAMQQLRQSMEARHRYREPLCMGLAGGIGAPASAAAAFAMGADFILTGSINQCTVESGATDIVKDMLQQAGIHDMAYAPAGDMFEFGARIQVLKKGLLFPMRANKLHALYTHYESLDDLPETVRTQLERAVFKRSLEAVWQEALRYLDERGRHKLKARALSDPKVRMARVFRWYFAYSSRLAFSGSTEDQVNYQVHTGPALGAFNQWVKGSPLESWRARHVDEIGMALMRAAARHLRAGYARALDAAPAPQARPARADHAGIDRTEWRVA